MIAIASFTVPEDAHLFRAYLESEEIEAFVFDEYVVQLCWRLSDAIGGVRVMVDESDADAATAAYRQYMQVLRAGPYPLRAVRAWPIVILVSMLLGMPFMIFGRRAPGPRQDEP